MIFVAVACLFIGIVMALKGILSDRHRYGIVGPIGLAISGVSMLAIILLAVTKVATP